MDFGKRIKARRLELQKTTEDVARIVGVSNATISRWETGKIKEQRRDKIKLLADALETTPSYLMGLDDPAPIPESELDRRILSTLSGLTDEDRQKALDYIALLKAAHRD